MEMDDMINQNQFKAFMTLLKKELIRIEGLDEKEEIKEELLELAETVRLMMG